MCYFIAICIIVYFYIGVGACLLPRKLGFYFSAKMMVWFFFSGGQYHSCFYMKY